jgi:hypothetical protein
LASGHNHKHCSTYSKSFKHDKIDLLVAGALAFVIPGAAGNSKAKAKKVATKTMTEKGTYSMKQQTITPWWGLSQLGFSNCLLEGASDPGALNVLPSLTYSAKMGSNSKLPNIIVQYYDGPQSGPTAVYANAIHQIRRQVAPANHSTSLISGSSVSSA